MSPADLAALVIGAVQPAIVAVVVRSAWPGWAKGLAALASSVVLGLVVSLVGGDLSAATWTQRALIVLATSQVMYRTWWQPTGIALALERATQPSNGTKR